MPVIRTIKNSALVALLVAALMAVGMGTAGADAPLKSDLVFALDGLDCGDGLTYDVAATGIETVRFKNDGGVAVFQNWHGTVVGSNGRTMRLHHAFTMTFAPDGSLKITGVPFGARYGGDSIVDRGIVVIDGGGNVVKLAGPHPSLHAYGGDPHLTTCGGLLAG